MKGKLAAFVIGLSMIFGTGLANSHGAVCGGLCMSVYTDCLNQGHTQKFCCNLYNTCAATCGAP